MKKIEAIIRTEKLEDVKEALALIDVRGMTVSQVMGCGRQLGYKEIFRGSEIDVNFIQKVKIELVVIDELLEYTLGAILKAARTGELGDGKIFIYDVADAIRIRTRERGNAALS